MAKNNETNLFTFLNAIFYKNKKVQYDKKIANAYIMTLWLSHDESLIQYANEINKYLFLLDDKAAYVYFFDKVPKGKRFIKYTKKQKKDIDNEHEEKVKELMNKEKMSRREAELTIQGG